MVQISHQDDLSLRITRLLSSSKNKTLEVFLYIPIELEFSDELLSVKDFYYSSISSKKTYSRLNHHILLSDTQNFMNDDVSHEKYRLSLSQYAHQCILLSQSSIASLTSQIKKEIIDTNSINIVIDELMTNLLRIRQFIPENTSKLHHYKNIDNYLSWFIEQQFLKLLSLISKKRECSILREKLVSLCEFEKKHRLDHGYNSEPCRNDPTRMLNKMRLLRLLIERPITLKESHNILGGNVDRFTKGVVTAFLMCLVSLALIKIKGDYGQATLSFMLLIAIIYAIRDMFKDDLRKFIKNTIIRNRPKWRNDYFDPVTGESICSQSEYLNYRDSINIPDEIKNNRKGNVSRNETVIHFCIKSSLKGFKINSSCKQISDTLILDLREISRLVPRDTKIIYQLKDGNVVKDHVEKRTVLNLITTEKERSKSVIRRWKIIINKSKIISLEEEIC